jgi:AAA domain
MSRRAAPTVVGLSGPDGAGKSTTLAELAAALGREGVVATGSHLYGCVLCRRWTAAPAAALASAPGPDRDGGRLAAAARHGHALVDAAELQLRLGAACVGARLRRRGTRSLVVTDRGPLDGLVKHDPSARSLVGRWYRRCAGRYQVIVWLDAPAEVLAGRDGEHDPAELAASRDRFGRWAGRLGNVVRVDTAGGPPEAVARTIRDRLAVGVPPAGPGS